MKNAEKTGIATLWRKEHVCRNTCGNAGDSGKVAGRCRHFPVPFPGLSQVFSAPGYAVPFADERSHSVPQRFDCRAVNGIVPQFSPRLRKTLEERVETDVPGPGLAVESGAQFVPKVKECGLGDGADAVMFRINFQQAEEMPLPFAL